MTTATKTQWTPAKVRDILPDVWIIYKGRAVLGRVRGRCNPCASVYIGALEDTRGYEFSWETITNALNADRPLRV